MRWLFGQIGAVSTAVLATLVLAILSKLDMVDDWSALVERLMGRHGDTVVQYVALAWDAIVIMALLVIFAVLSVATVNLLYVAIRKGREAFIRYKLRSMMDQYISKKEALEVIERSDYVESRAPGADKPSDIFAESLGAIHRFRYGPSKREIMVHQRLIRNLLDGFHEQRPDGVTEQGYDRTALEAWLDELFSKEVEEEKGAIPRV